MTYILAVFRVRTQTMKFNEALKRAGVRSQVINTPKGLTSACGISCKFPLSELKVATKLINSRYDSFVGFYKNIGNNLFAPLN